MGRKTNTGLGSPAADICRKALGDLEKKHRRLSRRHWILAQLGNGADLSFFLSQRTAANRTTLERLSAIARFAVEGGSGRSVVSDQQLHHCLFSRPAAGLFG